MTEDDIGRLIETIEPVEDEPLARAQARLDSLTKPPGSLGRLEELAARVAAIQRTESPEVRCKAVVVMAADHGVTEEGVSPYPREVTQQMVLNFMAGGAAIDQLAEWAGARLLLVDVGVDGDLPRSESLLDRKVARGTRNMALGPAMSGDEAAQAMAAGIGAANLLAAGGAAMIATGEMGIGNSTAAAALTCALTGAGPAEVCGPGTGLDAEGVRHKAEVVERALEANVATIGDPLGALAAVGGLELAGIAGVVLGCAARRVPVVADGFISGAAALAAVRIAPSARDYLFASHLSAEPGHASVIEALGMKPVLDLDMRLGEGTGAALAMGVIDAACRTMSGMATFGEAGVTDRD